LAKGKPPANAWKSGEQPDGASHVWKHFALKNRLIEELQRDPSKPAPKPKTNAQAIAQKLVENAKDGYEKSIEQVFDRVDGKPKQTVDFEGFNLGNRLREIGERMGKK